MKKPSVFLALLAATLAIAVTHVAAAPQVTLEFGGSGMNVVRDNAAQSVSQPAPAPAPETEKESEPAEENIAAASPDAVNNASSAPAPAPASSNPYDAQPSSQKSSKKGPANNSSKYFVEGTISATFVASIVGFTTWYIRKNKQSMMTKSWSFANWSMFRRRAVTKKQNFEDFTMQSILASKPMSPTSTQQQQQPQANDFEFPPYTAYGTRPLTVMTTTTMAPSEFNRQSTATDTSGAALPMRPPVRERDDDQMSVLTHESVPFYSDDEGDN